MKTLKNQFKTFFFLLAITVSFVSCSSDDDADNVNDNDPDIKGGQATAVIEVDNQTIQFSAKTNNSFATITEFQIEENEINKLTIVMMDDNSDVMIVAQVAPVPDNPIDYDLSNVGLGQDYFFSAIVALEGKNSADENIYGVGSYGHGEEIIQSKGSFKITSISNTTIKGTFEMTLYNSYDPNDGQDAEELTVTEGEFNLPIVESDE